jgi:hypothetical protein
MTTIRDVSRELQVPVPEVLKTLMRHGMMKTVIQDLTDAEPEILRNDPGLKAWKHTPRQPPPRPGSSPGAGPDPAGVREPRRPRPSSGAAGVMPPTPDPDE